ncbi:hypothetical protein CLV48_103158 [Cecembia rubra]|uniref:Uncharacterized protein n=1 Tax=Cecembia rubra TaxID=1485585 RepID=A0A2P8E834_9BACT|nr:hypothetical protein CLV48_103158 [Cecembia rubra]
MSRAVNIVLSANPTTWWLGLASGMGMVFSMYFFYTTITG